MNGIEELVYQILELNQEDRKQFLSCMKIKIKDWKQNSLSELKWLEQLEKMGFKD